MRPDLFEAVIANVPFVDVISTMSDPSIPLTSLEYDEWGNPKDKTCFDYMMTYSPYDNIRATSYPHLLVTTGLNDPSVASREPAKFAAGYAPGKPTSICCCSRPISIPVMQAHPGGTIT